MKDSDYSKLEQAARKLGAEHGKGAADWNEQYNTGGRTSNEHARAWAENVIKMDEDGDPELYDAVPHLDLSGQWADGTTTADVIGAIVADTFPSRDDLDSLEEDEPEAASELVDAYEEAYNDAAYNETVRQARDYLANREV